MEIVWSVMYENVRLLSLQEGTYDNGCGVHSNFYLYSLLWDKRNKRAVRLIDLFHDSSENGPALKMLSSNLLKQWTAEYQKRSGSDDVDSYALKWAQRGLAPKAAKFNAFVLIARDGPNEPTARGLTFLFSPYALSAYVFGSFSFEVTADDLRPYLAEEWKEQFH